MKKMIIASTSTIYGSGYLDYILPELPQLFEGVKEVLFIPYAQPSGLSYEAYTAIAKKAFAKIDIDIKGIHQYDNPLEAMSQATGVFVGGGNTFLLVKTLYKQNIMQALADVVIKGMPYFGTSAGSNICGLSMATTNDMPIVYPPSFKTLGVIPFNINPHYLDADPNSKHKGETRETRINEYHNLNSTPVLGLREGSWLEVRGEGIILKGNLSARLFSPQQEPKELLPQSNILEFIE